MKEFSFDELMDIAQKIVESKFEGLSTDELANTAFMTAFLTFNDIAITIRFHKKRQYKRPSAYHQLCGLMAQFLYEISKIEGQEELHQFIYKQTSGGEVPFQIKFEYLFEYEFEDDFENLGWY